MTAAGVVLAAFIGIVVGGCAVFAVMVADIYKMMDKR